MKWLLVKQSKQAELKRCKFIPLYRPNFEKGWEKYYFGEVEKSLVSAHLVYDYLYPDGCFFSCDKVHPNWAQYTLFSYGDTQKEITDRKNYTLNHIEHTFWREKFSKVVYTGKVVSPASNRNKISENLSAHTFCGCAIGIRSENDFEQLIWERAPVRDDTLELMFSQDNKATFAENFRPFIHCPICGKKIDWNDLYKRLRGLTEEGIVI